VEAKADGALATFDGTVLTALKEVEQALATYSGELHRHESLSASQAAAVATLTLGQVRYRRGSLSFLDFIALERTAVETEAELVASNSALANNQVAVFKALGGAGRRPPRSRAGIQGDPGVLSLARQRWRPRQAAPVGPRRGEIPPCPSVNPAQGGPPSMRDCVNTWRPSAVSPC
jgi:hypothetical protein